jgi:uncharacterized protein
MMPMPVPAALDRDQARTLLRIARDSIAHGLEHRQPLPVTASDYNGVLLEYGACFVSLHHAGELRGCIGTLEPYRPLAVDAAENAYAAAFRDHRLAPVHAGELERLDLEVHILGALQALSFSGLDDLYRQLRPGTDGLVLELASRRAVFLPVMWEQLPAPERFVAHLLRKAGITGEDCRQRIADLRARRFGVQVIRA